MMLTLRSSISLSSQWRAFDTCARTCAVATVLVMCDINDGTYEVVVIEAVEHSDDALALELVISSGAHRGDIVRVIARGLGRAWSDVLGLPAVLTVSDGRPRITLE
jgi:hypothetical protein